MNLRRSADGGGREGGGDGGGGVGGAGEGGGGSDGDRIPEVVSIFHTCLLLHPLTSPLPLPAT